MRSLAKLSTYFVIVFLAWPGCDQLPEKYRCDTDQDCAMSSSYCEECVCEPLHVDQTPRPCRGEIVACLVDPCWRSQPTCNTKTRRCELAEDP